MASEMQRTPLSIPKLPKKAIPNTWFLHTSSIETMINIELLLETCIATQINAHFLHKLNVGVLKPEIWLNYLLSA